MKSRSPQRMAEQATDAVRNPRQAASDLGNAAAQEGLAAAGLEQTPTLDALGLPEIPEHPASAAAQALGLGGLQVTDDHIAYDGKGLSIDESIDLTLGCIGPLTVGLHGHFATALDYGFEGDIQGGWFGGRYAEIRGHAGLDLDTSVQAKVALNLLVAEGGLRGGLHLKGALKGETTGTLSFDDDGVHLDSLTLHVEGEAALAAAAELYLSTWFTDEQTWELGSLPLGIASGFGLDLTWDDSGLTGMDGSLGTGFVMSPELEEVIDGLKGKAEAEE